MAVVKCETCQWFDADSPRAQEVSPAADGVCRRFPPPAPVMTEKGSIGWDFAEVDAMDWCGEYAPSTPAATDAQADLLPHPTQLTAEQALGVIESTLRQHQQRRDFRGDYEGCQCGARTNGAHVAHEAREVANALGYAP